MAELSEVDTYTCKIEREIPNLYGGADAFHPPCQVPRLSLSFVIGIEMVAPTSDVLV